MYGIWNAWRITIAFFLFAASLVAAWGHEYEATFFLWAATALFLPAGKDKVLRILRAEVVAAQGGLLGLTIIASSLAK